MKSRLVGQPNKRIRTTEHVVPMVFASIQTKLGKPKPLLSRVLLDSGASSSIVSKDLVSKLRLQTSKNTTEWNTAAGTFSTTATCKLKFQLLELSPTAELHYRINVHDGKIPHYDMILGRDVLSDLRSPKNRKDSGC